MQARLFAYADTQRYRIGSNYLTLPVNAPRCPFFNHNYDGNLNIVQRTSAINYFPSNLNGVKNAPAYVSLLSPLINALIRYPTDTTTISGAPTRAIIPKTDDFEQPGELFLSFDHARQQRFISRLVQTLQVINLIIQTK